MCSSESPWAVSSDLAYGYAAVNIAGGSEASWCCACYELTFTSGAVAGKKMIVQATNTGSDLGSNQFDISVRYSTSLPSYHIPSTPPFPRTITNTRQIPGGGVGIFNGCTDEWGAPSSGWGAQYGGISSASDCSTFPAALQPGCNWRFGWFEGTDNPTVSFTQVECPAAITAKSGCTRADDSSMPAPAADSGSAVAAATTATSSTEAASVPTTAAEVAADAVSTSAAAADPVATSADPVADPMATSADSAATSADPDAASSAVGVASDPPATSASPVVVATSSSPPVVFVTSTLTYKHSHATKPTIAPQAEDDACEL